MRFNLKNARRLKGYTPAEVAEELDISTSFYYKIEAGSRDPALSLAFKIADLLKYDDVKESFKKLKFEY